MIANLACFVLGIGIGIILRNIYESWREDTLLKENKKLKGKHNEWK